MRIGINGNISDADMAFNNLRRFFMAMVILLTQYATLARCRSIITYSQLPMRKLPALL